MIERFKYIIQAVAIERDDSTGEIIREIPAQPVNAYNINQAVQVMSEFEHRLQPQGGEVNGNGTGDGGEHHMRQPEVSGKQA